MGTFISGLVIEPLVGAAIIALCAIAIIEQNKRDFTRAEWSAIGAILVTFLLIAINILVAVFV